MSDLDVTWPRGYPTFYRKMALLRDVILNGSVLSLDPASWGSSDPGFAIHEGAKILTSGTLKRPSHKYDIYKRVQLLYDEVAKILPVPPDVLIIEEIHKNMASIQLLWAAGVSVAAARAPATLEVPLNFWKALAKATPGYIKSDAMDAEMMGGSVIQWLQQNP